MKNQTLLITIMTVLFSFSYGFSCDNPHEKKCNKTHTCEVTNENINSGTVSLLYGKECPDCYGTLMNTYKTEYCVGIKCRTRTLYKCSFDSSHQYWIYKD